VSVTVGFGLGTWFVDPGNVTLGQIDGIKNAVEVSTSIQPKAVRSFELGRVKELDGPGVLGDDTAAATTSGGTRHVRSRSLLAAPVNVTFGWDVGMVLTVSLSEYGVSDVTAFADAVIEDLMGALILPVLL